MGGGDNHFFCHNYLSFLSVSRRGWEERTIGETNPAGPGFAHRAVSSLEEIDLFDEEKDLFDEEKDRLFEEKDLFDEEKDLFEDQIDLFDEEKDLFLDQIDLFLDQIDPLRPPFFLTRVA